MNTSFLHVWRNPPAGSLPVTLAQLLAFGVPMSAIESDMRGEITQRGPWGIVTTYRALCMSTVYADDTIGMRRPLTETVHGMRTMTQCQQNGYQLDGRVTVNGRSYRAFTSSQLFDVAMPDGSTKLISVATIQACIPDADETRELTALSVAGLIPVTQGERPADSFPASLCCLLLGYRDGVTYRVDRYGRGI